MNSFSTPGIILKRLEYGDYDLIITFFTLEKGKISAIAKYAKKSSKRFSGVLELFSLLNLVYTIGRRKGIPVLQEAEIIDPFPKIREKIQKTAYASYWAEMINNWTEPGSSQISIYNLFKQVLQELDRDNIPEPVLSILFQMRFLTLAGLCPNLTHCSICKKQIDSIQQSNFVFDLSKGGLACNKCRGQLSNEFIISKGTVKQLLWIGVRDFKKAVRVRFTSQSLQESLNLLEAFVAYHVGKEPASLKVLRQIR